MWNVEIFNTISNYLVMLLNICLKITQVLDLNQFCKMAYLHSPHLN